MKSFYLAIDQGTTGSTALAVDAETYQVIGKVNHEFKQHYSKPGYVEHDLNDIYKSIELSCCQLFKKFKLSKDNVLSIGITNQRETTCVFDKSGNPLAKAIVWQDRRTDEYCQNLKVKAGLPKKIHEKTGLTIDPYFSASKLNWFLKNNTQISSALNQSDLLFGTIDTYLLYKLSAGEAHLTDATNASRTMLMNISDSAWDNELLDLFEIPKTILPEITDTFYSFARTKNVSFLKDGTPITCIIGDQQSALLGQGGINRSSVKCTYGTGAFLLFNTGNECLYSSHKLLTTIAFQYQNKKHFAIEGSCYIAGALVQWLRDQLKFFNQSHEIEKFANNAQVDNLKDLHVLPFFTGMGAPYWNSKAKASILGLGRYTTREDISYAALEGICFSVKDLLGPMLEEVSINVSKIMIDGGMSENNTFCQLQSDILNTRLDRPKVIETTAYGAALGSAVGLNHIKLTDIPKLIKLDKTFEPSQTNSYLNEKYNERKQLIQKLYF